MSDKKIPSDLEILLSLREAAQVALPPKYIQDLMNLRKAAGAAGFGAAAAWHDPFTTMRDTLGLNAAKAAQGFSELDRLAALRHFALEPPQSLTRLPISSHVSTSGSDSARLIKTVKVQQKECQRQVNEEGGEVRTYVRLPSTGTNAICVSIALIDSDSVKITYDLDGQRDVLLILAKFAYVWSEVLHPEDLPTGSDQHQIM